MDWSDVGKLIDKAAPLAANILTGNIPGAIGSVGSLIASALGTEGSPDVVHRALVTDPMALAKVRDMELTHQRDMAALAMQSAANELAADTARLGEVNATMRAEVAANDAYVRRWRPTFGYAMAFTWTATMVSIAWITVAVPAQAPAIIAALVNTSAMWGVALAVLGIAVHKRSQDKAIAAGATPQPGMLGAITRRIAGGAGE